MLRFRDFIKEADVSDHPIVNSAVNIDEQKDSINANLEAALEQEFITPHIALERVRNILVAYDIRISGTLPGEEMGGDEGDRVFGIIDYDKLTPKGDENTVVFDTAKITYSVYFAWELNESGSYEIWCQIVDDEELEALLNDDYDEEESETESD